jgi:hypothetical protein
MLWEWLSLLTNSTRVPGLTDNETGLAPAEVIVTVVDEPPLPPDGEDGELPPHAAKPATSVAQITRRTMPLCAN